MLLSGSEILAHLACDTFCSNGCLEQFADLGIFILIFDLIASLRGVCHHLLILSQLIVVLLASPPKSQVACRNLPDVKVLVPPHFRWDHDAARLPVETEFLTAVRPHKRVSFAFQDQNVRAGPMAMSFFV